MPSLFAREQNLPASGAPAKALADATTTQAAGGVSQDEIVGRPSGPERRRIARRQGSAALGRSLAAAPDETLVDDVRAALTPSEMVNRKLAALLGVTPAGACRRLPGAEGEEMPRAPPGHYDWDIAGNAVAWDEAYDRLLGGRPRDTSTSQDWWIDRIHPDDRDRTVLGLCGALDGAASRWTAQYRVLGAGGECVEVCEQADIMRDAVGEATGLAGQMSVVARGARGNRYGTPAGLTSA